MDVFLMHLLDCTYGSLVALLAWSIVGAGVLYVACIVLVPVAAIIRFVDHMQAKDAIARHFGIKSSPISKDARKIRNAEYQTKVMAQQYKWIFSKRGVLSLLIAGAVLFGVVFLFTKSNMNFRC